MKLLKRYLPRFAILTIGASASAANLDNPLPPVNPIATMSDDFAHVTLAWEYPGDIGENGGVVDPNKITYYIFDAFGSFYDPAIAVTQATSYEFDYSNQSGQDFVAYQLTAGMDETWYSLPVNSNIVCVGQPQTLPFIEEFAGLKQTYPWCIDPNSSVYVSSSISKDDGDPEGAPDKGCLTLSTNKAGQTFAITSVKVAAGNNVIPKLLITVNGKNTDLAIDMSCDGGEFTQISTITPVDSRQQHAINMTDSQPAQYLQLTLKATFYTADAWLSINKISISDDSPGSTQTTLPDFTDSGTDYFTLDGRRLLTRPSAPGIYICRCNNRTTKFVVR